MTRKRTPLNRKRVLTDPAFERSRENSAEFSRACTANRLLRKAFSLGITNKADRYVSGRLTKTMYNVLKSDEINDRGERRVSQGSLSTLLGFNFNRDTSLQNVLKAPYSILFDQEAMLATISFPSLLPKAMIETASEADAFLLTAMAVSMHFEKETIAVDPVKTDLLYMDPKPYKNLLLQLPVVGHQPDQTIVVALGIEFYQETRGYIQSLHKKHNALAVIKVF